MEQGTLLSKKQKFRICLYDIYENGSKNIPFYTEAATLIHENLNPKSLFYLHQKQWKSKYIEN